MPTPLRTGTNIMPMMNDLLRIAIPASAAATVNSLSGQRMSALRGNGVGPRDADEDVVERRPRDLEVLHRRPRRERREKALRIAGHAHFLHVAVVVDALDAREAGERGGAARRPDADRVEAVRCLDLV